MSIRHNVPRASLYLSSLFFVAAALAGCSTSTTGQEGASPTETAKPQTADLVIKNGKVATVDAEFSIKEAIAIKGNRIIYVGDNENLGPYTGPETKVIDAQGQFVMPGMTDAHCHPFSLGGGGDDDDFFSVGGTKNFDEVVAKVAEKVKTLEPGEWIIGGGWDQNDWPGKQLPIHDKLSAVSPDNPVFLYRHGGNSAFANAKALEIANITKDTPDPFGGKILRKPDNSPTGFVVNMGNNLIKAHFPSEEMPMSWYHDRYVLAAKRSNEVGLTGWHDAGNELDHLAAYKSMADEDKLTVRVNMMLQNPRLSYEESVAYFKKHRVVNYNDEHFFQVRSVKMYFDGALGSRGAAMFEPYLDDPADPNHKGVFEVPPEHVYDVARAGLATGMQIAPHAIGNRANWELLNAFEKALKQNPVEDHRFRSEHAEVVRPQDVKRFADIGVIASIQPIHCTSDMGFLPDRIGHGECGNSASPWRNFISAGVHLASGSDFMVESHRPLWGIYAAITRQDHDALPAEGWYSDQRMTREEAIRSYTTGPAYAAFWENDLGSLEQGKLADIVILDHDILTVEPKALINTKVVYTIVDGKVVYKNN